jgi:hypothetical protein
MAAAAGVEAVEDNLSAKAAGNESVDGRMTVCDDEIGRRTTTQQPTNERRVRMTTMATATARWAAARRDMATMGMATGNDDDDDDDDGATTTTTMTTTTTTMATARRATGYDDDGGGATDDGIRRRWRRRW